MFVTLLKKQLLEINWTFFVDKKTGQVKTKGKVIGSIVLFAALLVYVAGMMSVLNFYTIQSTVEVGFGWLGMTISAMQGIALGVFGSVFNTYGMLYKAKDNELLVSLPIPDTIVLLSKLCGVAALAALYSGIILLPCMVIYQICNGFDLMALISSIIMFVVIVLLVSVITCALGYIIAIVSSKIKKKSIVTVICTVIFLGLYYYVCMNLGPMMDNLVENITTVSQSWSKIYVLYALGASFTGELVSVVLLTGVVLVLSGLTIAIMGKNYGRLSTIKFAEDKKEYKQSLIKSSSVSATLLKRELAHLLSSSIYMLNSGLGIIFMLAGVVGLIYKGKDLMSVISLEPILGELAYCLPIALTLTICLVVAMDCFSASSISLEGKNIWIAQSLPVDYKDVLMAKIVMPFILNGIPALLLALTARIVFRFEMVETILMIGVVLAFVVFAAVFGLAINLKMPNLKWTNEVFVVKQSGAVFSALFGGWAIIFAFGLAAFLLIFVAEALGATEFMAIMFVVIVISTRVLYRWTMTKGVEIFADLH